MNFIKTSKFSVKGIDTTRYIPNEVRNLLLLCFLVGVLMGLFPTPSIEGGDPSQRRLGLTVRTEETPRRCRSSGWRRCCHVERSETYPPCFQ